MQGTTSSLCSQANIAPNPKFPAPFTSTRKAFAHASGSTAPSLLQRRSSWNLTRGSKYREVIQKFHIYHVVLSDTTSRKTNTRSATTLPSNAGTTHPHTPSSQNAGQINDQKMTGTAMVHRAVQSPSTKGRVPRSLARSPSWSA